MVGGSYPRLLMKPLVLGISRCISREGVTPPCLELRMIDITKPDNPTRTAHPALLHIHIYTYLCYSILPSSSCPPDPILLPLNTLPSAPLTLYSTLPLLYSTLPLLYAPSTPTPTQPSTHPQANPQ